MNDTVRLLDPLVLDGQRTTLHELGEPRFKDLSDEALAELTFLGLHPMKLRAATLSLVSRTSREELLAYGLSECYDADRFEWALTPQGNDLADLLASRAPEPSEADLEGARRRTHELLKQARAVLEG